MSQAAGMPPLPEELILAIAVNSRPLARLSCSPWSLEELALGWLYSQRIIDSADEVLGIALREGLADLRVAGSPEARLESFERMPVRASAGGLALDTLYEHLLPLPPGPALDLERLRWAMDRMIGMEEAYKRHGGVHCAMLAQAGSYATAVVMEDLGRSNTIDKVLGWGLLNDLRFPDHLLFVTGRISSEMILKAYRAGIPAIVSLTTMSSKAYEIAQATGQTLVSQVMKPTPILVNFQSATRDRGR